MADNVGSTGAASTVVDASSGGSEVDVPVAVAVGAASDVDASGSPMVVVDEEHAPTTTATEDTTRRRATGEKERREGIGDLLTSRPVSTLRNSSRTVCFCDATTERPFG
jgi:hypothetical protein